MSVLGSLNQTLAKKLATKYDHGAEKQVREWMATLFGDSQEDQQYKQKLLSFELDLQQIFKNGEILCQVINILAPGTIPKINKNSEVAYKQMENITKYLNACEKLGMRKADCFITIDLYEKKDLVMVLSNIVSLRRMSLSGELSKDKTLKKSNERTKTLMVEQNQRRSSAPPKPSEDVIMNLPIIKNETLQHSPQRTLRNLKANSTNSITFRSNQNETQNETQIGADNETETKTTIYRFHAQQPQRADVSSLSDDIAAKELFKYHPELERKAKKWIEQVLQIEIPPNETFNQTFKSGVLLCQLINAIKPGTIKEIHTRNVAYYQMENIQSYLKACHELGLRTTDLFDTTDLYDSKNLNSVISHLHVLGKYVKKIEGYNGPLIEDSLDSRNLFSSTLVSGTIFQEDDNQKYEDLPNDQKELVDWINEQFSKFEPSPSIRNERRIQNLRHDIKSGVVLLELFEILSKTSVGMYEKNPQIVWHCMQNASLLIHSLSAHIFNAISNCSPFDIVMGNIDQIMSLIRFLREKFDTNYLYEKLLLESDMESYGSFGDGDYFDLDDEDEQEDYNEEMCRNLRSPTFDSTNKLSNSKINLSGSDSSDTEITNESEIEQEKRVHNTKFIKQQGKVEIKEEKGREQKFKQEEQREKKDTRRNNIQIEIEKQMNLEMQKNNQVISLNERKLSPQKNLESQWNKKLDLEKQESMYIKKESQIEKNLQAQKYQQGFNSQSPSLEKSISVNEGNLVRRLSKEEARDVISRKWKNLQKDIQNVPQADSDKNCEVSPRKEVVNPTSISIKEKASIYESKPLNNLFSSPQQKKKELISNLSKQDVRDEANPQTNSIVSNRKEENFRKSPNDMEIEKLNESNGKTQEKEVEKKKIESELELNQDQDQETKIIDEDNSSKFFRKLRKQLSVKTMKSEEEKVNQRTPIPLGSKGKSMSSKFPVHPTSENQNISEISKEKDKKMRRKRAQSAVENDKIQLSASDISPDQTSKPLLRKSGSSKKRIFGSLKIGSMERSPLSPLSPSQTSPSTEGSDTGLGSSSTSEIINRRKNRSVSVSGGRPFVPKFGMLRNKNDDLQFDEDGHLIEQKEKLNHERESSSPKILKKSASYDTIKDFLVDKEMEQENESQINSLNEGKEIGYHVPNDSDTSSLVLENNNFAQGEAHSNSKDFGTNATHVMKLSNSMSSLGESTPRLTPHRSTRKRYHDSDLPPEERKKIKAQAVMRKRINEELLDTERSYVQNLKSICRHFVSPLEGSRALTKDEIYSLVSNIDEILSFHEKLFADLEQRASQWNEQSTIHDIFEKYIDQLIIYQPYMTNYNRSSLNLIYFSKKNVTLAYVMKSFEQYLQTTTRLALESLFIMPVQRIPRYILLLKEIKKYTPESNEDFQQIPVILSRIESVLAELNKGIKKGEQEELKKIQEIFESVEGDIHLVLDPDSKFRKEGTLQLKKVSISKQIEKNATQITNLNLLKLKNDYTCYLFSHCLLFCKLNKGNENLPYKLECAVLTDEFSFLDLDQDKTKHNFWLTLKNGTKLLIKPTEREDALIWMSEIEKLLKRKRLSISN